MKPGWKIGSSIYTTGYIAGRIGRGLHEESIQRRLTGGSAHWALPIPCGPGKHRPLECLRATAAAIVAAHSSSAQSELGAIGSGNPNLFAVDSSSARFASLFYCPLSRH
jgi:hypothetical protein